VRDLEIEDEKRRSVDQSKLYIHLHRVVTGVRISHLFKARAPIVQLGGERRLRSSVVVRACEVSAASHEHRDAETTLAPGEILRTQDAFLS
jgi:hypothetical protein